MTRGVLFYNHGVRCLPRLMVAVHTLRRHYSGAVAVAAEGEPPEPYRSMLAELGARLVPAPVSHEYGLVKKSRLWRITPFDVTLFLDADTLIRAPVSELLDLTEKHGLLVTKFHDWKTTGRKMRARIEQWRPVSSQLVDKALAYGWAINTGIQGWKRGHPALRDYEETTEAGLKAKVGKKTLDEIAMQLVITRHPHYLAGSEWNVGPIHGKIEGAKILHYHGHKHTRAGVPACEKWKKEWWKLCDSFPNHKKALCSSDHDDSLSLWLQQCSGLTIVTAVNPEYADRCKKNLDLWLKTPGLSDQRFLVFVHGFKNSKEREFLNRPNVKVVRWSYPFEASTRETMLAAFVLGVAEHVKTDYWMKLDCDSSPKKDFQLPDYHSATITSHKWGYTKMKGDSDATEHWFNRLDAFFSPKKPMFKTRLDPKRDARVSHRSGNALGIKMRFASFCHFEKTAFTKRMAKVIKERGGRLPIPSQDTLSWYCATLWKEPVKLMNMKEWFQP